MKTWVSLVTAMLLLITGLVVTAPAEVVGRLTLLEGRVDLLKGGQLPANPAKLEDPVELGDVLRTKSLSKAIITFVDNTVITISPESRIAIEEYMFDPAKGQRNAVLQLFHGMALAVVSKIFKVEQPDFVIKTHTAIMGVRGTEVGVRLSPNDSTFLNFQGLTRVASIFPEISGDLFRKAAKVAFSFGKGYVDLGNMQATTVTRGMPPTLPYGISNEDRQMFMRQMIVTILGPQSSGGGSAGSGGGSAGGGSGGGSASSGGTSSAVCSPTSASCATSSAASSSISGIANAALSSGTSAISGITPSGVTTAIYIAPVIAPTAVTTIVEPTPSSVSLAFSQLWSGPGAVSVVTQPTANFFNTGPGNGTFSITSFDPGSASISLFSNGFTVSSFALQATMTSPSTFWNSHWTGIFNSTATGNLTGLTTGSLTGTMNMLLSIPLGQTFTLQGPVTYNAGTLTFNFRYVAPPAGSAATNVFATNGGDPRGIVNSGTWTQVKK